MERNEAAEALRNAERAEAAPWIDHPTTPAWYPPAVGAYAAALVLVLALLDGPARTTGLGVLVVVMLGFLTWNRRHRGVLPQGRPPREFRRALAVFGLGLLLLVLGCVAVAHWGEAWVAAGLGAVAATALVAWYERACARAAEATRQRLG